MSEQFLHRAQIRSAFEQVGRGAVSKAVRRQVRGPRDVGNEPMDRRSHLARVDPPAPPPEEERGTTLFGCHRRAVCRPRRQCLGGRAAERDDPLLAALAEDPHHSRVQVDVVDIATRELADPQPAGIQQFQHRSVPGGDRIAVVGSELRHPHQLARLGLTKHPGQVPDTSGGREPQRRVGGDPPGPGRPPEKGADTGRSSGNTGPGSSGLSRLGGQPATEVAQVDLLDR